MQWLDDHGYEAVTLGPGRGRPGIEEGELPPKPIVVSFDDGYPSQYASAFPVLQSAAGTGVLNLIAHGSELPTPTSRRCSTPAGSWPRTRSPTPT